MSQTIQARLMVVSKLMRLFGFLLLLSVTAPGAWARGQCMRPGADAPCMPGGLTSNAQTEPSVNTGAGNPVHLATGHKVHIEHDGPFRRHYHAGDNNPGTVLGPAWAMDWETRLHRFTHGATILHADGSRTHFTRTEQHAAYTGQYGRLEQTGNLWLWQGQNGQSLAFNQQGLLVRLRTPSVDLSIARHTRQGTPLHGQAHTLVLNNQRITLQYKSLQNRAFLSQMIFGDQVVAYEYQPAGAANTMQLHKVSWPNGTAHRYHYALYPPRHAGDLIGIDKQLSPQSAFLPWRHWTLDAKGRVVLLALHEMLPVSSPTQLLTFNYQRTTAPNQDGITSVQQANGQQTHFFFKWVNGRARLHAVSGDPCPGCAAPGTRALYTRYGELKQINGLQIQRNQHGKIQTLNPRQSGWPNLKLHFNRYGQPRHWSSSLTGTTVLGRTPGGQVARRTFANGDTWHYHYDGAGRPVKIIASGTHTPAITTTLQWRGNQLIGVEHPYETLLFEYDVHQRLIAQQSVRRMHGETLTLRSRFAYNSQNRLIRHDLPEGGRLHYTWRGSRIQRLVWEDAQGHRKTIVQTPSAPKKVAGYQYGNGMRTFSIIGPGFARQILQAPTPRTAPTTIWQQTYRLNTHGLVTEERLRGPVPQRWHYTHDHKQRIIGATLISGNTMGRLQHRQTQWYAWHESGALLARKQTGHTAYPDIQRDTSGLPVRHGATFLQYGPDRRLKAISGLHSVHYQHNAFGQLIGRETPNNGLSLNEAFWYLNGQRVAERQHISTGQARNHHANRALPSSTVSPPPSPPLLSRRYLYVEQVPIGFIQYSHRYPNGKLYFVHSDLLGAPRLVTNSNQKVMWQASYSPTGQANIHTEHLRFNLRLPGQHADPDSGWHDNLYRTYNPLAGDYLEPDPLGPFPGGDALGYANQQPRRYIDPLGLMLFAFDGTRNNAQTQSNVWKLAQRYEGGPVFYQAGPGNPYNTDWDALTAYTAPDIINKQWQNLLGHLDNEAVSPDNMLPVDILGYSRGSAIARHFANQVSQYTQNNLFSFHDPLRGLVSACVDLRFLGLFDTVAQFGIGGSRNNEFNMTIGDSWQWVAHAIALHEHRWLFPLMVVGPNNAMNTVEAPFVGAHADIGGGILINEHGQNMSRGDLSDISLNWMLWQARAASLQFSDAHEDALISNPILHDARSPTMRTIQNGDRSIENADGTQRLSYQDGDPRMGRVTREQVEAFIQRLPNWRRHNGNEVGHVDMDGYAAWLYDALGWQVPDTTTGNDSRYH